MHIVILGGGFTGLSAAYYLSCKEHTVTLIESESQLGGLAGGFRGEGWEWPLERTYHHIFSSDSDIQSLLKEAGFEGVVFSSPTTASLYETDNKFKTFPLDTPLNLLLFPLLTPTQRIRAGMALGLMKVSPYISTIYDKQPSQKLMEGLMGKEAFDTLFGEMLRRKFGKYAENILASFFWSRIKKRTKNLGYMRGGFQEAIDFVANSCRTKGASIIMNSQVVAVEKTDTSFNLQLYKTTNKTNFSLKADIVISTLPSATLAQTTQKLLSEKEVTSLRSLKYLSASNLILETDRPIFKKDYWISLCAPTIPGLVFVQHTNFMDKSHYNNNHILYIGSYGDEEDKLITMSKEEMIQLYTPHLEQLSGGRVEIRGAHLWKTRHAQPIFDANFLNNVPRFETSVERFYVANLDMTYPYDRGTNYAVALGKRVADLAMKKLS